MKQSVLILLISILAMTSCLEEGINGCPDYMRVTFLYESSTRGYDEVIANDVHLRLYKDGIFYSEKIIPYEEIAGGQEYSMKKETTGNIEIVAWAVPSKEENVAIIPTIPEDKTRSSQCLKVQSVARRLYHESMGYVYLGTINYYDSDISEEINIQVPMNNCIAQFSATIHNLPEKYIINEEEFRMEIHGTKSEMDLDFNPHGEDACIIAPLIKEENSNNFKTDTHGLLPSAENQFISVMAYQGNTHLFTIKTDFQSHPGDIIHLDIFTKTVTIHVNDWRIIDVPVEWI